MACSKPPKGNTAWSCRKLAEKVGVGSATVNRILNEGQIKPHKVQYWCGKSTNPEFENKQAAIIGLYLNPPENAMVLAVDEKSQIQALDRSQPMLPIREGNPKRLRRPLTRGMALLVFLLHWQCMRAALKVVVLRGRHMRSL